MSDSKAYDIDLAYIHDTGYGDFAKNAAPSLLKTIARADTPSQLVVDLGCGSGIWAKLLADSGYQVLGVDISTAMIEIARQRTPQATFHTGSFVDFKIPACRAVTALGEVFNYLFDTSNSLQTLKLVFQKAYDALVPNGTFIFDVSEPGRSSGLKQGFREGKDWACLVEYQHDEQRQQVTRRIVTFRRFGDTYRRSEETHRQQLYQRSDITHLLTNIGFQVEILPGYGEISFPKGLVGFIASKA